MDWIFDNFQILVVIGVAVASWLKHRADQKKAEEEERQARKEMADPEEVFGPEEDWPQEPQHFPEPPPLVPSSGPPPLRPSAPPPVRVEMAEVDALLRRQQEMQERLKQIRDAKATTTGDAAATRARVAAAAKHPQVSAPGKAGLHESLRDKRQTRRAMVLREILGPPVGLR
jgi:hypothetical protein